MDRFFELAPLLALGLLLAIGGGRTLQLRMLGVKVLPPLFGRPLRDVAKERTFSVLATYWMAVLVIDAWPFAARIVPPPFDIRVLDMPVAKFAGMAVLLVALAVYARALRDLGKSWRLWIDPEAPGALVTHGIYRLSRNPIYVALALFVIGVFFLNSRIVNLVAVFAFIWYLDRMVRKEEQFLEAKFGHQYREYLERTPRYVGVGPPIFP